MAESDRDLPLPEGIHNPHSGSPDNPPVGLLREVLRNREMLTHAMVLVAFFSCLIGVGWASFTESMLGFSIFFPAAIALLVWAMRKPRRKRSPMGDDVSVHPR
ncbi:hypothetical protein [Micromonospora sp. DT229]|uniref:hypothetical protein n=1 Tax=Micromonospora sp. DT229 TaxID=3393430 RepID=UPI003CE85A53